MKKLFFLFGLAVLYFFSSIALSMTTPLPANEVFSPKVRLVDPNSFFISWKIKPGFFLYADRIKFSIDKDIAEPNRFDIGTLSFPPMRHKKDKLGHVYPVYRDELTLPVPILGREAGSTNLFVTFQGCADDGFCYPPETLQIELTIDDHLALTEVKFLTELINPPEKQSSSQNNTIATVFSTHHWPVILIIFFGLGLLLSFTPCILPMIPVLSGIIIGHDNLSTKKAFFLSLSYVLSMAFTYALIGLIVASLGENLQIIMQAPSVIGLFAGIFVILALSMFGLFDIKIPVSWQAKLAQINRQQSNNRHHYIGAAIMGCLSILVLSPCVTPPLVGALSYIAESGNMVLGAAALFSLGLGMGVPLLLIGTSAAKCLPKAGAWMNTVKSFFGFLMLAVAIYLLSRITSALIIMALWAVLFIFAGICSGALIIGRTHREKLNQSIGIILLVYGLALLIGACMGNDDPLHPLKNLNTTYNSIENLSETQQRPTPTIKDAVTNPIELKSRLDQAQGKLVILDFYADWCTSCKVMEETTFKNPAVISALKKFVVIKIDITQNTAAQRDLLKEYNVIAPPTFIFLNKKGQELINSRLVGEISSRNFLKELK